MFIHLKRPDVFFSWTLFAGATVRQFQLSEVKKMTNVKPRAKGRNIRQFFKHHTANDKHQILIQVESFSKRQLKTILMDKKLRETTNLYAGA